VSRLSVRLAGVGLCVALIGAALRLVADLAPVGDMAVMEVHVLNVMRHLEPVGAYSRYGWNHPGPLHSMALVPLYWLSGYRHVSLAASAILINVVAVIAFLRLTARESGDTALLVTGTALLAVYLYRVDGLLASPWNPHMPVLVLPLLAATGAAVAVGHLQLLPLFVALGSFAIQAHVGFAAAVVPITCAAVVLWALNVLVARKRGAGVKSRPGRPLLLAAIVALALWCLPIVDAVRPAGQHNLQMVYTFLRQIVPGDRAQTERVFAHYVSAPFTPDLRLAWGTDFDPIVERRIRQLADWQPLLLGAAALGWAVRRRRFEAFLAILVLAGSAGAHASIHRLPTPPQDHAAFWVSILGVSSWTMILALPVSLLAEWIRSRRPGPSPLQTWGLALVALLLVTAGTRQAMSRLAADRGNSAQVESLTRLVRARLPERRSTTPLLHVPQDRWGMVAGLALQLYRDGDAPHVDIDWVSMFGEPFRPDGREVIGFDFGDDSDETLGRRPGYRRIESVQQTTVYEVEPRAFHGLISDKQ
jgi:hypothetical protein